MVMGFNTEIKHKGVVYHVQTEPRKGSRIETVVYLGGQIVHSLKTPCALDQASPEFSEDRFKRRLEEQHRHVIASIQSGELVLPQGPKDSSKSAGDGEA